MHTGIPFVSVGFTAISALPQTLEQQLFFFSHYLVSAESPEPSIYHTVSHSVYIQTSALHIFHTIYFYVLAAQPRTIFHYVTLYHCMLFFLVSFSLSHYQQNKVQKVKSWKVASILHPICPQESAAMSLKLLNERACNI